MHVWNVLQVARWKCRTPKNRQKFAIWAPSHNFVELYLRNWGMYRQSEKPLNSNVSPTRPYNMVIGELRPTSGWDLLAGLGHPCKFQRFSRLGSVTARHSSSGRQPNFAALNRGRYLSSAGRPSCWALAHILVRYVNGWLYGPNGASCAWGCISATNPPPAIE